MAEESSQLTFRGPPPPPPFSTPLHDLRALDTSETHGPLEFSIGWRKVTAITAERLDPLRTVYRLKIQTPSILDCIPFLFIRLLFERLFNFCPFVKSLFPGWFLPPIVILKKCKPNWDEEFKVEKSVYDRLLPLQGIFVPHLYGEAKYDGSPALVLSEIIGTRLHDLAISPDGDIAENDERLEEKLIEVYRSLASLGVVHGDSTLHNVFDAGDRAMLVDFEQSRFEGTVKAESTNEADARGLVYDLQLNRKYKEQARRRIEEAVARIVDGKR